MDWNQIELMVDRRAYKARFRQVGELVEIDWNGAKRACAVGPLRAEVAAANGLRSMIARAAKQAQ